MPGNALVIEPTLGCDHPIAWREYASLGPSGEIAGTCRLCGEDVREKVVEFSDQDEWLVDMVESLLSGEQRHGPRRKPDGARNVTVEIDPTVDDDY